METVTLRTVCGCLRTVPVTPGSRDYVIAYALPMRLDWAPSSHTAIQNATRERKFRWHGDMTPCGTRMFREVIVD